MALFDIEFITPTRSFDIQDVEYAKCPGLDGSFGVMANHTDSVISLSAGEIKVLNNSESVWLLEDSGLTRRLELGLRKPQTPFLLKRRP